ncbi:MAG: hypothetical protein AAGC68_02835 [Verrucomicrobiota bacterium]
MMTGRSSLDEPIMKRFSLCLVLLFTCVSFTGAEQYANLEPGYKCRFPRKNMSFCKMFPQISFNKGLCNPAPKLLGHIEWCREDITVTERDDCGNYETYEALVITYRKVYCNGAWGEKFKRTYRKEPTLITPPLAKNVLK